MRNKVKGGGMSKTTQVMKLCADGKKFTVVHHADKINPYWLYEITHSPNKYGVWSEHKKLIIKYANMASCLYYLTQIF